LTAKYMESKLKEYMQSVKTKYEGHAEKGGNGSRLVPGQENGRVEKEA